MATPNSPTHHHHDLLSSLSSEITLSSRRPLQHHHEQPQTRPYHQRWAAQNPAPTTTDAPPPSLSLTVTGLARTSFSTSLFLDPTHLVTRLYFDYTDGVVLLQIFRAS